jgi:hypothetical protein
MIILIVFVVIGIIIGLIISDWEWDFWVIFFSFTNVLFGAIIGVFIGLLVATTLPMKTYLEHSTYNIANLQDNNSVSGQFFLGSGQIDGKMQYVFYLEENDFYTMHQIEYNLAQIKHTDSIPKINVYKITQTDAFINYFAIDWNIGDQTYIIEVPKGTIKTNYNLDAQ